MTQPPPKPPPPQQVRSKAQEILGRLEELKIEVSVEDGRLRFRPREAVPTDLIDQMRAHKAELVALVRRQVATERLIAEQLAQLVYFQTPDGRRGWVHPAYREILDCLGM